MADLLREGRLGDIRGLGVDGIAVIGRLLESAGLRTEIDTARETNPESVE